MPYTKTIKGKSKQVLITGTAKSLVDLLGQAPDAATNRLKLFFTGSLTGVNTVAMYSEDKDVVPTASLGRPLYPGGIITITPENFETFLIIKTSGADFNMWAAEFDSEQDRL